MYRCVYPPPPPNYSLSRCGPLPARERTLASLSAFPLSPSPPHVQPSCVGPPLFSPLPPSLLFLVCCMPPLVAGMLHQVRDRDALRDAAMAGEAVTPPEPRTAFMASSPVPVKFVSDVRLLHQRHRPRPSEHLWESDDGMLGASPMSVSPSGSPASSSWTMRARFWPPSHSGGRYRSGSSVATLPPVEERSAVSADASPSTADRFSELLPMGASMPDVLGEDLVCGVKALPLLPVAPELPQMDADSASQLAGAVRQLDSAMYAYLGPIARNKVVRALEMAQTLPVQTQTTLLVENVSVAAIVADLQWDVDTVIAAVLRGLVSSPSLTFAGVCSDDALTSYAASAGLSEADVEANVGGDVLLILRQNHIVDNVVEVTKDSVMSDANFATLRQLILATATDVRAVALQLATAVVHARQMASSGVPCEGEDDVGHGAATRTLSLYAPLANQLGVWAIQTELEELGFEALYPEECARVRELVGARMGECAVTLEETKRELERTLSRSPAVRRSARSVRIRGRVKGIFSLARKMARSGKSLDDIHDLLALRVIVQPRAAGDADEMAACYDVMAAVNDAWSVVESRSKDYLANPKPNGYRSLHTTVRSSSGTPLEVQVRTEKMHVLAEYGQAAHWIYKETGSSEPTSSSGESSDRQPLWTTAEQRVLGIPRSSSLERPASSTPVPIPGVSHASPAQDHFYAADLAGAAAWSGTDTLHAELREMQARPSRRGQSSNAAVSEAALLTLASVGRAIRDSWVIVCAAGQLHRLAVGSTLLDLAVRTGVVEAATFASKGVVALVNGRVVPSSYRLRMNDNVSFVSGDDRGTTCSATNPSGRRTSVRVAA